MNLSAAHVAQLRTWPEWLAPMVVKELGQGLRARWFVVPFIVLQMAASALTWIEFVSRKSGLGHFSHPATGHFAFWLLAAVAVVVILPLRGLASLDEEMRSANAQLILMAGQTRWRIVLGKWLTQMGLGGLMLVSLLPYGLVRYFFGGVEASANISAFIAVVASSAAMNALFIGASGYDNYWLRAVVSTVALIYVGSLFGVSIAFSENLPRMGLPNNFMSALVWLNGSVAMLEGFMFFTLCGLQLGRARLRFGLRPWELPPSRAVMILLLLGPVYGVIGSLLTCGLGAFVVLALLNWWVWSLDPAPMAPPPQFNPLARSPR